MVRNTSIDAYRWAKESGFVSRLQFEVYDAIFHHGPLTGPDVWKRFFPHLTQNSINPRLVELEEMELIQGVGLAQSPSGRPARLLDVTANYPKKRVKSAKMQRKELEKRLRWYEDKFGPYTGG